jgi:hypothetical protein
LPKVAADADHKAGHEPDCGLVAWLYLAAADAGAGAGSDSNGSRAIRRILSLHLETEQPLQFSPWRSYNNGIHSRGANSGATHLPPFQEYQDEQERFVA